ncbi:unnamed protein product [Diamesa serratosioi]
MNSKEFAFILNLFLISYIPYGYTATIDCTAGPPLVNPRECCERPEVIEDSIFSKCFSEYGLGNENGNQQERNTHNKMGCVAQCVLNTIGILEKGQINANKAIVKAKVQLNANNEQIWIPIITDVITNCSAEANNRKPQLTAIGGECNNHAGFYIACCTTYAFRSCPKEKWTTGDDDKCDQLKQFLHDCPIPVPRPN